MYIPYSRKRVALYHKLHIIHSGYRDRYGVLQMVHIVILLLPRRAVELILQAAAQSMQTRITTQDSNYSIICVVADVVKHPIIYALLIRFCEISAFSFPSSLLQFNYYIILLG